MSKFLRKIMVMHDYGDWEDKHPLVICSPSLKDMYAAMQEMFPAIIDGNEDDNVYRNTVQRISYETFQAAFMREVNFFRETTGEDLHPTDNKVLRAVSFDLQWDHRVIFREIAYQRTQRVART